MIHTPRKHAALFIGAAVIAAAGACGLQDPADPGASSDISRQAAAVTPVQHAGIAWEYRGRPLRSARIAGCQDGSVYMMDTGRAIWRSTTGVDASWTFVATAGAAQDISCSDRLWAFNDDRTLWRNDGTPTALAWTKVGLPFGAKQVSTGWRIQGTRGATALFALNDDNTFWQSATGADGTWTQIGQPEGADRVTAGRTGIWRLDTNKTLYRGNGLDTGWSVIDTPGLAAQISDDGSVQSGGLWALNVDNRLYHGKVVPAAPAPPVTLLNWTQRGTPSLADRIAGCADGSIYALNYDKTLWRNTGGGADPSWVYVGTFGATQDITCWNRLYAFNTDRSLYRNDGTATSLVLNKVGQPTGAKQIVNGWNGLYALNDNQTLYQSFTGADGTWTPLGTPGQAARIAAGNTGLWALNTDQNIYRGDGLDTDWKFKESFPNAVQISGDSSTLISALWILDANKGLWHGVTGSAPSGIEYQGGNVMGGVSTVYFIWYGNWTATEKTILTDLASSMSGPYWNINTSYTDFSGDVPSSVLAYGGSTTVSSLTHGSNLAKSDVTAIIQDAISAGTVPNSGSAIYAVMAGTDIDAPGYCSSFCGYHGNSTFTFKLAFGLVTSSFNGKYAFVPNAATICPTTCGVLSVSPNGSPGADAAASVFAHEVSEAITDPQNNAWVTPSISGGAEDADMCSSSRGTVYPAANGALANVKLGARDFLLQQLWVNTGPGSCGLSVP